MRRPVPSPSARIHLFRKVIPAGLITKREHELLEIADLLRAERDALRGALTAVKARIDGEFDRTELVAFGALSTDTKADVLAIISAALAQGGEK